MADTTNEEEKWREYDASIINFIMENQADLFNVIISILIFIVYGFVLTIKDHGLGDGEEQRNHCDEDWRMGYCTGKYGPGTFPVTLTTFITANTVFFFKMAKYVFCPDVIERRRRKGHVIMNARMESTRLSEMGTSKRSSAGADTKSDSK
jgi:hypothetical protein